MRKKFNSDPEGDFFRDEPAQPPSQDVPQHPREVLHLKSSKSTFDQTEVELLRVTFSRNQFGKVVIVEETIDTRRCCSGDAKTAKTKKTLLH